MRVSKTYDNDLLLKDAGLVAASAAAQVDSADKIIDLGAGFVQGEMVVDVSAIEIASNDEKYDIQLQLSSSSSFASTIQVAAQVSLGAAEVLTGDQDSTTGRYTVPFDNEFDGTVYRYARTYTVVAGTVATGINFEAFIAKK